MLLKWVKDIARRWEIDKDKNNYLMSQLWVKYDTFTPNREVDYLFLEGYHVFIFGSQRYMVERGILEMKWDRYEDAEGFRAWLNENLRGFYDIKGWGNGRGNKDQLDWGIWQLQVWCKRDDDAALIKLTWM